jgi:hypothetical protein
VAVFCGHRHRLCRLDPIRGYGQQDHIFSPLDEHGHYGAIGPLRMRTFARPEVDDNDLAAVIMQSMENAIQVG